MYRYIIFLIFCFSNLFLQASPYTPESIPDVRLQDKYNHVSNPDGIIDTSDVQEINSLLNNLEDSLTIEVQVVAVQSIGEEDTRMFANKLFNLWGIGLKEEDNGLLILLVIDQREIVFETGYGMEEILPDALCYRMQQEYMVPYLKDNEFSAGMREGVKEVTNYLLNHYTKNIKNTQRSNIEIIWEKISSSTLLSSLFFIYVFITLSFAISFIVYNYKSNKKITDAYPAERLIIADSKVSLASLGCVFVFFPITSIIDLLWYYLIFRINLSNKASVCPNCHQKGFRKLKKSIGNAYLSDYEKMEIKLGTVNHFVFQCSKCSNISKYKIESENSAYQRCPSCSTLSFKEESQETIVASTFETEGERDVTYECKMCNYTQTVREKIPVCSMFSNDSGSDSGSSGGSSWSSSRGGSHGGGSSGGGGSKSRF